MKRLLSMFALIALAPSCLSAAPDWLTRVPAASRAEMNPLGSDPRAALAGARIFTRNCASCHGKNGQGHQRRPSLRTARVRKATDGELQWLLRNGALTEGMPSWSNLPEAQRWQVISYLRTLPQDGNHTDPP